MSTSDSNPDFGSFKNIKSKEELLEKDPQKYVLAEMARISVKNIKSLFGDCKKESITLKVFKPKNKSRLFVGNGY